MSGFVEIDVRRRGTRGRSPNTALMAMGVMLCGCTTELPTIVLDISKNCNEVEVLPLATDVGLTPSGARDEIVRAAADGSASASAWLMVVPAGGESGSLMIRHMVGGEILSEIPLPIPASRKQNARLRASPNSGEVYVTLQGPGDFFLWRVVERDPIPFAQASNNLAAFPNDTHNCSPCDNTDWYRDLIFIEGQPHLISVPPFSPTVAISVWVGSLAASPPQTGNFVVDTEHRLNFEPRCDPGEPLEILQGCEATNALVSHPAVRVLGRQSDPSTPTTAILAGRERQEFEQDFATHDIFVVHVGLDDDGIPAGILRSEQPKFEISQPPGPPSGLAVDEFATYAQVTMPLQGTRLLQLRLAAFEEGFTDLNVPDLDSRRLLQLDNDLALGQIVDGNWEVTKLFPDAIDTSKTTVYQSDAPILEAEGAGPGVFLLRRQDAAPELVRLACANETSTELGTGGTR